MYFARLLGLVLATDLALTTSLWKLSTSSAFISTDVSSVSDFSCFSSLSFSSVLSSFS